MTSKHAYALGIRILHRSRKKCKILYYLEIYIVYYRFIVRLDTVLQLQ